MRQRELRETAELASWEEVASSAEWTGLLVGNGASVAIWAKFRYDSLFGVARSNEIGDPLSVEDLALVDAFNTTNFEHILASLKTARTVARALEVDVPQLSDRYRSVQRSLFESVHEVHVPWMELPNATSTTRYQALREYRFIYSTNYDLLLYWASMEEGGSGFLDFFWGPGVRFDPFDTEIWTSRDLWTRILFLHGGIHLRRMQSGGTRKVTSDAGNLLSQFETAFDDEDTPLLVSEGESEDKLRSILSSDYLSFGHQSFVRHEGGLAIFGHSLSDADEHLVAPMRAWRDNPIAISIRPADDATVIQSKAYYRSRLAPLRDLLFFDSTTHPLGVPNLRVEEED
jgi:hypothetical protein